MTYQLSQKEQDALDAVNDLSDGSRHDWRKFAHALGRALTAAMAENERLVDASKEKDRLLGVAREAFEYQLDALVGIEGPGNEAWEWRGAVSLNDFISEVLADITSPVAPRPSGDGEKP